MLSLLFGVLKTVRSSFKSRGQLTLENLALRQQLAMLRQSVKRPRVSHADRMFWILFAKYVDGWRAMLHALHPDTVVRWHREGFRRYWRWKSRRRHPGRPLIDPALRKLIREMQSRISAGVPLEFMGNSASLALRSHKQRSRNICRIREGRPRKRGGRFL